MQEYVDGTGSWMDASFAALTHGIVSPAPSVVVHPDHYNWIKGIECRDVIQFMPWNVGEAVKYCWRHNHKGKPAEDLRKAVDCLQAEIKRLGG